MTKKMGTRAPVRRAYLCEIHRLKRRCPGCEATRVSVATYPPLNVPPGTVEWLRESSRVFVALNAPDALTQHSQGHPASEDGCAVCFAEWVGADMREAL